MNDFTVRDDEQLLEPFGEYPPDLYELECGDCSEDDESVTWFVERDDSPEEYRCECGSSGQLSGGVLILDGKGIYNRETDDNGIDGMIEALEAEADRLRDLKYYGYELAEKEDDRRLLRIHEEFMRERTSALEW